MAEEEALGSARRPPPERLGEDDRLGLLGAAPAGGAGLDPARLGRTGRGPRPGPVHDGGRARPGREARRPLRAGVPRRAAALAGARGAALIAWVARPPSPPR